jgi:hypothetical protein
VPPWASPIGSSAAQPPSLPARPRGQ